MAEAVSQHKRMAMGEAVPMAPGKSVIQKYAGGGKVMPEKGVANLSAKGGVLPPMKATGEKIATYKKGGKAKMPALTVVIGVPRKAAGRGR
jgi:hypothetical protein